MKRRQPEPGDSPESSESSWSPPELSPYNLRQHTSLRHKRFKMSNDRAYWNTDRIREFLILCIEEKRKLNFTPKDKRLTHVGWRNIYESFHQKTGKNYSPKQLQNKYTALKNQHKAHQRGNRSQSIPYQNELDILFGDPDTEDGDMMCISGIGERTPSRGTEQRSHRSGHEVDSLGPKRPKSVECLLQRAVDCLEEMSKNESSMLRRQEKHENMVKQLLQMVCDDGVELGSDLYFIAAELIRDETRRTTYSTLITPEQRVRYLHWAWEQFIKK